jgi:3-hydroxyisobutyrate dehydrogenase
MLMSEAQRPVVGFVGLGEQGAPIAHRIARAGYPMVLWARRPASLDSFRETDVTIADSLSELASRSDMVCLCVLDDNDVAEVLHGGLLDGLRPGALIVVNSTTKPETCRRLADEAAELSVSLIDAPVSGMARGAAEGTMAIFVGGSEADFERYAPIAHTFGTPTHVGHLGTGQIVKILNNVTGACNLVIAQDTLAIGEDLGIEREILAKALLLGSGESRFLEQFTSRGLSPVLQRDPDYFLRDWTRILGDLEAMLSAQQVAGRLVQELGRTFVARTSEYVSSPDQRASSETPDQ